MNKTIATLLYCYIAILPFGQLLRIPPQSTQLNEVHFYLTDLVVGIMILFWVGKKLLERRRIELPPLSKPIFAFILICFCSLLVNTPLLATREVGVAFLYLVRWIAYAGVYFVVFDLAKESKNWKQKILNLLIFTGMTAAILGLIQYIFLPDTRFLANYGWDPHWFRAIGTFLDPGFLGAILVLTIILLVTKIWENKRKFTIYYLLFAICYLSMVLTYSRGSYLAFLVGIGVISWVKKNPKIFLGVLGLLGATIILLPRPEGEGVRLERDSTIRLRIINWQHALLITWDHPIIGVGFNSYRYMQEKYGYLGEYDGDISHSAAGVDSSLLFVLVTTGILGLSVYLWLWKKSLKTKNLIVLSSGIAILVHSFFTNTLFYPWVMGWWWILLGIDTDKPLRCEG